MLTHGCTAGQPRASGRFLGSQTEGSSPPHACASRQGSPRQSIPPDFDYVTLPAGIKSYMSHYMAWLPLTKVLQGGRSYYRNRLQE